MGINYYGWNPPWYGGHQNVMSRQSGDRIIKNDVLQLLMTMKRERLMRPGFGTIIKSSLFDQIDDSTINNIGSDVMSQLSQYEPRVNLRPSITRDDDHNTLNIQLNGYYTNQPDNTFEIELNLPLERQTGK